MLTTTHVLAGVDRAVRNQFGGLYPPEIIASALRMLGKASRYVLRSRSWPWTAG